MVVLSLSHTHTHMLLQIHVHNPPYSNTYTYTHSRVIILTNLSNGYQGLGILVRLVRVNEVEGGGLGRVTVASGEVHTHREVDLTSTHDVIKEGVGLRYGLEESRKV